MNNKEKIKLVAFDMDGTIYTSEGILVPAYHIGIEKYNIKHGMNLRKPTVEELEHQIGQPVKIIFRNLFPEMKNDAGALLELSEIVLDEFLGMIQKKGGRVFEHVEETLKILTNKGYKLAIASNGREPYLAEILNAFDLKEFFVPLVTINDTTITKKADILKNYMEQFQLTAEEIVMVGDRSSDLEAARIVNCQFIGCDYGFAAHEIETADRVVKDFKDILQYL